MHGFDCCQRGSYTERTGGPDYLVKKQARFCTRGYIEMSVVIAVFLLALLQGT